MRIRRILFTMFLLVPLGACSWSEPILREYQCDREASNRPDEIQRRAECQQRNASRPAPPSQRFET
jgi:hypothetical protein